MSIVTIDGSITDRTHPITLRASSGNRHGGLSGGGVELDNSGNTVSAVSVLDEHVTFEGFEIRGGGADGIHYNVAGKNESTFGNNLIHQVGGRGIRISSPSSHLELRNNILYGNPGGSIQIDVPLAGGSAVRILNNTVYGPSPPLISAPGIDNPHLTLRNNIFFDSAAGFPLPWVNVSSSHNVSDDPAPPVGPFSPDAGHSPRAGGIYNASVPNLDFHDTTPGNENLHLRSGSTAEDNGIALGGFNDDVDGETRNPPWDMGADEIQAQPPFRIHYRSIGLFPGNIASGSASIGLGSVTVTLGSPLPFNAGRGDRLVIGGEEFFILSVDSATQVTVQTAATLMHSAQPHTVTRAYNKLQDWESDREGDLVAENRREVGIVYDDGPFDEGVEIDGSKTDRSRFLKLTVARQHRHRGLSGSGAVVDGLSSGKGEILVADEFTVVEWLEVRGVRGAPTSAGIRLRNARDVLLAYLLVHDNAVGVRSLGAGDTGFISRNSIIYDNDDDGVRGDQPTDTITLENCTLHGNGGDGVDESLGTPVTVTNTISVANLGDDFAVPGGSQSFNLSSDATATGPGSLSFRAPTENPNPGSGNWVIFMSLAAGSENLHLQASPANQAIDAGIALSPSFWDDVDSASRIAPWDMGADELGVPGGTASLSSASHQNFTVGSVPSNAVRITITEDLAGGNVTATNDLRLRIPAGFHMRWDDSVTMVTLGGVAAGRVDSRIQAYEDMARTVVLEITSDFLGLEALTVDDLRFASFTAPSPADNLELELGNDGIVSALDDKLVTIITGTNPSLSSEDDQVFTVLQAPELASPITVTDASDPVIAPGNGIEIVIPNGLGLTWDSGVTTPTFGGPASSKVAAAVTYTGGDKRLTIDVLSPFDIGDYLIVSGVRFTSFTGAGTDALELELNAVPVATDDKTLTIIATGTLQAFTATSTSTNNHLEWVNPNDPAYVHTRILAREDGVFPFDPFDLVNARLVIDHNTAPMGDKAFVDDGGLTNGKTYFYSAFAFDGTQYSAKLTTTGRPFDHLSGDLQWAYATGPTAMAPPGLRFESQTITFVYAVSNDSIVHAMNGSGSAAPGEWPSSWKPYRLGGPAQARPAVVPFPVGGASQGAVFVGAEDGTVYAIDADTGGLEWQSGPLGDRVLASPNGIFMTYGGKFDSLAVGSRNASPPNVFRGLNPFTGAIEWTFDNSLAQGGDDAHIGIISAIGSVSYQDTGNDYRRFFFTSRAGTSPDTVWCVETDGADVRRVWSSDLPGVSGSRHIHGSPVLYGLYGGRIYVGTNLGAVVALDAASGTVKWVLETMDGAVKEFLFPRYGSTNLFFSTTSKVWSVSDDDTGYSLHPNWPITFVPNPSTPLVIPGTTHLLVGSGNGHLYQLDQTDPAVPFEKEKLGDGSSGVGMPTIDVLNDVIYVGTEQGVIYAIRYPLLP